MKKSIISTLFVLAFTFILSAEEAGSLTAKMPAWIVNEGLVTSEKVCAAAGKHINDKKFVTKYGRDATDLARLELAKSMKTEFDAVWKHFESTCTTNNYSCDSFVKENSAFARVNTVVKAAPRENLWDDGNDVWALVCMSKERYDAAVLGHDFDPNKANEKEEKALKEKEIEKEKVKEWLLDAAHKEWAKLQEEYERNKKQN